MSIRAKNIESKTIHTPLGPMNLLFNRLGLQAKMSVKPPLWMDEFLTSIDINNNWTQLLVNNEHLNCLSSTP